MLTFPKHKKLLLPIEMLRYVQHNGLIKPFTLFLAMKCFCQRTINIGSPILANITQGCGIRTQRTLDKYLQQLLSLNWIGYDACSGTIFIRGLDSIRETHGFTNTKSSTFYIEFIPHVQEFIAAALIGSYVSGLKFLYEIAIPRRFKSAPKNKDGAKQDLSSRCGSKPDYYGISLVGIALLFNCSKTRAVQLKKAAIKSGLIKARHRFEEVTSLDAPDYKIRRRIEASIPDMTGKLVFRKTKKGKILLLEQCKDEISCMLIFKKRKKFDE
jgi:hypothetical protein